MCVISAVDQMILNLHLYDDDIVTLISASRFIFFSSFYLNDFVQF